MSDKQSRRDKIDTIVKVSKAIASIVVPIGVSAVTKNFTALVRPPVDAKTATKVIFGIGDLSLQGMVAYKASQYADETIEELGEAIKQIAAPEDKEDDNG